MRNWAQFQWHFRVNLVAIRVNSGPLWCQHALPPGSTRRLAVVTWLALRGGSLLRIVIIIVVVCGLHRDEEGGADGGGHDALGTADGFPDDLAEDQVVGLVFFRQIQL